jgi:hypothetical protein
MHAFRVMKRVCGLRNPLAGSFWSRLGTHDESHGTTHRSGRGRVCRALPALLLAVLFARDTQSTASAFVERQPWALVTFTRQQSFFALSQPVLSLLPYVLLAILLCARAGGVHLARRYLPSMRALRAGMAALQERRYERVSEPGTDEMRGLIAGFNCGVATLQDHFHALQTFGEIDKLLLGSAELEQVLDAVLAQGNRRGVFPSCPAGAGAYRKRICGLGCRGG